MKPAMNESPTKLSGTTHMLYADVDQWRMACDCPCPDAADYRPIKMLRLSGTTEHLFADFAHPMPLELSLFCGQLHPGDEIVQPWRLNLIEDLDEYGIPTLLEGALMVPENTWSDLKENLLLAAREPGHAVQVRLETREFLEKPSEFDPARNFAVIAFGFELHYCKEAK